MDHDSDSEPSEILEHEGHTYEKKWIGNTGGVAVSDWVLWKCVERGCIGQIATAAVRTKRWRRKRFIIRRNFASNRLTAVVPRRPHNHAPSTAHREDTSKQIETSTTAIAKLSPMPSPTSSLTDVLAAPKLNDIDTFHLSQTKLSLLIPDFQNINSINLDNVSKSMENVELTETNFDDGIQMSNVDTMESQVVKPVSLIDHQTNSKEGHLKDINVTVNSTNIIQNVKKKNLQIKYGNPSMSTQNKNDEILCNICGLFFGEYCYNEHIKTTVHLSACEEYFKDRIDFENYRIFSCSVCVTTTEFFKTIKQYFTTLVNHILLEHNALVVDIYFFALYHEDSLNLENKNIAEVKHFDVYNKELTKNTDVYELYKDIVKSFIFQSDALKTSDSSWTLEEILYVEISKVKEILENEVTSKSLDEINHNNETSVDHNIDTDKLRKTQPLQLIRCKLCGIYVVQQNYERHIETTAHQISLFYLKNEKIQINGVQSDNCFLSCRILSPKHVSIDQYFQSIESDVVELIAKIIKLQNDEPINVNIKMFGLYNHNSLISKSDTLGDVKSFLIRNEILSGVTILLRWIQKILNKFKSHHQQYLKSMPQSYYLERVMFLDLCFYEMTSI